MDPTLKHITTAILEIVDEEPSGAPSGPMYLALMSFGVDLNTYLIFMGSLVRLGYLTKSNDCYHITETGKAFIRKSPNPVDSTSVKSM